MDTLALWSNPLLAFSPVAMSTNWQRREGVRALDQCAAQHAQGNVRGDEAGSFQ